MVKFRLDETLGDQGKEAPLAGDETVIEAPGAQWSTEVTLNLDELPVPWMGLMQGLSKPVLAEDSGVVMGDWYIEGYGPEKKVEFVPLMFGLSRNYGTQDLEGELIRHCYSPANVEHGVALDEFGPGIACADCELRKWQPSDKVKNGRKVNSPPLCKVSYDFQGYSVTHGTICKVGFRSTSEQVGAKLAMLAKQKGLGQFMVELGSERASNGKFTYAKAKVTILEPDPNVLAEAMELIALPSAN